MPPGTGVDIHAREHPHRSRRVQRELSVLDDVFSAVRNDGRFEDDIILLGDLNADKALTWASWGQVPYLTKAIVGQPTNTRTRMVYDNILFDSRATTELTGRVGIVDLMRDFNLSEADALRVSDHLPNWAEFSLREGGDPGRVAATTGCTSPVNLLVDCGIISFCPLRLDGRWIVASCKINDRAIGPATLPVKLSRLLTLVRLRTTY